MAIASGQVCALGLGALWMLVGCSGADGALGENVAEEQSALPTLSGKPPNPVALYSFDLCAGSSIRDDSGGRSPGTMLGRKLCSAGKFRSAGDFNGSSDAVQITDAPKFNFTNAMTVAAWVKPTSTSGTRSIVNKWSSPNSYMLSVKSGQYSFTVAMQNGTTVEVKSAATANQWAHVAGVLSGGQARLFVNGVQVASAAASGNLKASTRPVMIGNHPSGSGFSGLIEEVRLYNVGLSQADLFHITNSEVYSVAVYYVRPSDLPHREEYVTAMKFAMDEVTTWYRDHAGVAFRIRGFFNVVGANYVTMRCGPFPSPECQNDVTQIPAWLGSVSDAIGGFPSNEVSFVFSHGGGGFAGANLVGQYSGFAVVGDWVLEPLSGVREPLAPHCGFEPGPFYCQFPLGTVAHEIGHAFGLHHNAGPSIMAWHGDYPNTQFLPHEQLILQLNPMLSAGGYRTGSPFLDFGNADGMQPGSTVNLFGSGFTGVNTFEFVDGTHVVHVPPTNLTDFSATVTVPNDMSLGFIRPFKNGVAGNPVPVNFE